MLIVSYNKKTRMGLGDFLRGALHLYRFCKKYKIKYDIDFKYNDIYPFLINKKKYKYRQKDIIYFNSSKNHKINYKKIRKQHKKNKNKYLIICTNIFKNETFNNREQKIFKNKLKLNIKKIDINNYIKNNKNLFKNYELIHIRFDDKYFINDNFDENIFFEIENLILNIINIKKNYILISNSKTFKNYMKKHNFLKIFDNEPAHLGKNNNYLKAKSTAFDIYLIQNAKKIYTYSQYKYLSGFVYWLANIYNI